MDHSTKSSDSDNDIDIESQSANESFEDYEIDDEVSIKDEDDVCEHVIPSIDTMIMDNKGKVEENARVIQPTEGNDRMHRTHETVIPPQVSPARTPTRNIVDSVTITRNRCKITILHFVLTYPRWSIALFISLATATFPLSTYEDQVSFPIKNLKHFLQMESHAYSECIENGFQQIFHQMEEKIRDEETRGNQTREINGKKIQQISFLSSACNNATESSIRALQVWETKHGDISIKKKKDFLSSNFSYKVLCPKEDSIRLMELLKEDYISETADISYILDEFVSHSISTVSSIIEYSEKRSSYDYHYFIGVKIQSMTNILNLFSFPNVKLSLQEQLLLNELRKILLSIIHSLEEAYSRLSMLKTRLAEFKASLDTFYTNYLDLYSRIISITFFVKDFIPSNVILPSYFNISDIPFAGSLMPPVFNLPNFDADLPNIELLTSDAIQDTVKMIVKILSDASKEISRDMKEVIQELLERLKILMTLDDYNPPSYKGSPYKPDVQTVTDELTFIKSLASKTRDIASDAIHYAQLIQNSKTNFTEFINPDIGTDTQQNELNENDFERNSFFRTRFPSLMIPNWVVFLIAWLSQRAMFMEFLTQTVRFWRLKRKYEKNSNPDLPEIVFIDKNCGVKEESTRNADLMQSAFLKHVNNMWIVAGAMLCPVLIGLLLFWFPHVRRTCVESRDGTFIARNMLTPSFANQANRVGNEIYTSSMLSCRQKQRSACATKRSETIQLHHNDHSDFLRHESRYNTSKNHRDIIHKCVDTDHLDTEFGTHCCGLRGYTIENQTCSTGQVRQLCAIDNVPTPPLAFRPIGEATSDLACQVTLSDFKLDDSSFDCDVIKEICDEVPCSGVDVNLILNMTIDADCSIEIYIIQVFIFISFALFHAIMINFIFRFLFDGFLCLWWRNLRVDGFKMLTHVNENGTMIQGADLTDRLTRINKAIVRYERFGRVQVVLSVVLFILWLILTLIFRKVASHFQMYHE